MKVTMNERGRTARVEPKASWAAVLLITMGLLALGAGQVAGAEAMSTATVQGTVYLANGQPGAGTLRISWPGFTTASGQTVVADSTTVAVGQDGFVSVTLAPNLGATPAGLYYTAVFYMSDGSVNTQYWVVPAAAQATLAQVQTQVMPASQAVQAVSKAYVDQAIAQVNQSELMASGGTLTGPLFLSGDPAQPLQAADKHYVDSAISGISTGSGTVNTGNSGQVAYYTANGTSISGINSVPVAAGGTGGTSAQEALANLGGVSSMAASQQTMAGPLTANVNGIYAVTVFGARGDATPGGSVASATDNCTPIQSAINAAYATGGAVFFPTNTGASGQTIYYTSCTINPKGVSMYGPPGSSGSNGYTPKVGVRGASSKDVFAVGDPSAGGYVTPLQAPTMRDLAIYVDDSTNASSSFPHRFPGRHCFDVTANGTNVISSAAQCKFQWGDIGQNIQVGSTTATITAVTTQPTPWASGTTTATLSTTVSTGTNLSTYVSVYGLSVTQTLGNCALSYDSSNAANAPSNSLSNANFSDLFIGTTSGNYNQNYSCGFLVQGLEAPYSTHWSRIAGRAQFFFNFVPSDVGTTSSGPQGLGDFNTFDDPNLIYSQYPFIAYGGGYDRILNMQTAGSLYGPQILGSYGGGSGFPGWWHIDAPELEGPGCSSGANGLRLEGLGHQVQRFGPIACPLQIDSYDSVFEQLSVPNGPQVLTIAGSRNTITKTVSVGQTDVIANDATGNNVYTQTLTAGPFTGRYAARRQCGGLNASGFGPAQECRGATVFNRTADFVSKGAANYFFNLDDLWFWPDDLQDNGGWTSSPVDDSTTESGRALTNGSGTSLNANASNSTLWYIGSQFPAGKMRMYAKVKDTTSAGSYLAVWAGATLLCSQGISLTTSYQVFSVDCDASSYAGQQLSLAIGTVSAGTQSVAWIAFRPWVVDEPVVNLQIGSGVAMTGNHGTQVNVQHSDGTGASGNLASYNADGSLTNGPAPASGALVGTTDTQTLTNKSIAGSEINSGTVGPANGGTGQNESSATGVGQWNSGTYSVSNALANGTTATTQSAGDNSTKVATTAYVASPGSIAPASVTSSGLIVGGNDTTRTTVATIGTTSFSTTGLVLPTVPASGTRVGRCIVYWQMSSTSYTATFGVGMSNAPTGLWGGASVTYASGGTSSWLAFSQTATAATAVSSAATAGAANTTYRAEIDFTLQTGATNPVALTVYGEVSNASATLSIEPGSACYWLP